MPQQVLKACDKEIEGRNMKEAIENIVKFLELFRKPEHIIRVSSGRYIEKEVPSLKYAEMTHQMEQELMGLPRFTAWAKIAQEKDGKQLVIKRKIQTLPLPDVLPDADEGRAVIEGNTKQFYMKRDEIEEEIRSRQERWRGVGTPVGKPASPRSEGRGNDARKDGPPPRSSRPPPA
jgi:hypothetical protein